MVIADPDSILARGYARISRSKRARLRACILGAVFLAGASSPALATTKGLNQIVTPDIQPRGLLSVSYQQQDPVIGNPSQVQLEQGITPRFEVAIFHGNVPGQFVFNSELGVIQRLPYLVSVGFANWSTSGQAPQTYAIAGYYKGAFKEMAGGIRVGNQWESLLGSAYQANPRLLLQLDFQSGAGNSTTAGFTYNFTPTLSLNPALYYSNDAPHRLHPYAVLTWNIQVF